MSYPLIINPEAELDLEQATQWYNKRRHGLGYEFLECVDKVLLIKSLRVFDEHRNSMLLYIRRHVSHS